MASQQIKLKWTAHSGTIFSIFNNMLATDSLTDVTLAAENQYIKAHKLVLCACSPYFQELLSAQHNDKNAIIFLKDVRFSELKALISYMYKGEANIFQEHLPSLLKVAESLQIRGLSDADDDDKNTFKENGGAGEGKNNKIKNSSAASSSSSSQNPPSPSTSPPVNLLDPLLIQNQSHHHHHHPNNRKQSSKVLNRRASASAHSKENINSNNNTKNILEGVLLKRDHHSSSTIPIQPSTSSAKKIRLTESNSSSSSSSSRRRSSNMSNTSQPQSYEGTELLYNAVAAAGAQIKIEPPMYLEEGENEEDDLERINENDEESHGDWVYDEEEDHDGSSQMINFQEAAASSLLVQNTEENINETEGNSGAEFYCDKCNKRYTSTKSLWRHRKFACSGSEGKLCFTCTICQKVFSRSDNLRRHSVVAHLQQ